MNISPHFGQLAIATGVGKDEPVELRLRSARRKDREAGKTSVDEIVLLDSEGIARLTRRTRKWFFWQRNPLKLRHWEKRILPELQRLFDQGGELHPEQISTGQVARKHFLGPDQGMTVQDVFCMIHPQIQAGLQARDKHEVRKDGKGLAIHLKP